MEELRAEVAHGEVLMADLNVQLKQREAKARRKARVANLERVVLGVVVAWQIVLTVGLVYVALTGQPAEQPAEQSTCPSPDE